AGMVSAGVASNASFWMTRRAPPCVVTSRRPSGVKARAIGEPTLATRVSLKPAGTVAAAGAAQTPSHPSPMQIIDRLIRRTRGLLHGSSLRFELQLPCQARPRGLA